MSGHGNQDADYLNGRHLESPAAERDFDPANWRKPHELPPASGYHPTRALIDVDTPLGMIRCWWDAKRMQWLASPHSCVPMARRRLWRQEPGALAQPVASESALSLLRELVDIDTLGQEIRAAEKDALNFVRQQPLPLIQDEYEQRHRAAWARARAVAIQGPAA